VTSEGLLRQNTTVHHGAKLGCGCGQASSASGHDSQTVRQSDSQTVRMSECQNVAEVTVGEALQPPLFSLDNCLCSLT
jgi:hypothetical protein